MKKIVALKTLLLAGLLCFLAGCKLAVIVVEGGEVEAPGITTCMAGEVCIHTISDTTFYKEFKGVPDTGWHFVRWNSGDSFFCQDSTSPNCVLSNASLSGIPIVEAIVASDATFYIMPIFEEGLATIVADGNEWAQPEQFTGLSWDEINLVCPAGVCAGVLSGFDMTGWTWATVDDMNALLNSYIGTPELGPGPDSFIDSSCTSAWAPQFFDEGWRISYVDYGYSEGLLGWTATPGTGGTAYRAAMIECTGASVDQAGTSYAPPTGQQDSNAGSWFYR